jgi:hypothetical protein
VGNTFRPCNIHKAVKDELEPVFLQRLQEDQERYDAGLNITPEMAPEKDRGPIFHAVKERRAGALSCILFSKRIATSPKLTSNLQVSWGCLTKREQNALAKSAPRVTPLEGFAGHSKIKVDFDPLACKSPPAFNGNVEHVNLSSFGANFPTA